jgi:hypothetical protein
MVERWKVKHESNRSDARRIEARMLHGDALIAPAVLATSVRLEFKRSRSTLLVRARILCLHTTGATLRAH